MNKAEFTAVKTMPTVLFLPFFLIRDAENEIPKMVIIANETEKIMRRTISTMAEKAAPIPPTAFAPRMPKYIMETAMKRRTEINRKTEAKEIRTFFGFSCSALLNSSMLEKRLSFIDFTSVILYVYDIIDGEKKQLRSKKYF